MHAVVQRRVAEPRCRQAIQLGPMLPVGRALYGEVGAVHFGGGDPGDVHLGVHRNGLEAHQLHGQRARGAGQDAAVVGAGSGLCHAVARRGIVVAATRAVHRAHGDVARGQCAAEDHHTLATAAAAAVRGSIVHATAVAAVRVHLERTGRRHPEPVRLDHDGAARATTAGTVVTGLRGIEAVGRDAQTTAGALGDDAIGLQQHDAAATPTIGTHVVVAFAATGTTAHEDAVRTDLAAQGQPTKPTCGIGAAAIPGTGIATSGVVTATAAAAVVFVAPAPAIQDAAAGFIPVGVGIAVDAFALRGVLVVVGGAEGGDIARAGVVGIGYPTTETVAIRRDGMGQGQFALHLHGHHTAQVAVPIQRHDIGRGGVVAAAAEQLEGDGLQACMAAGMGIEGGGRLQHQLAQHTRRAGKRGDAQDLVTPRLLNGTQRAEGGVVGGASDHIVLHLHQHDEVAHIEGGAGLVALRHGERGAGQRRNARITVHLGHSGQQAGSKEEEC